MKDYRIRNNRQEDPYYITEVDIVKSGLEGKEKPTSFNVHLANGTILKGQEYTEENLKKLKAKQEKQAKEGVENAPKFRLRRTFAGIANGLSLAATSAPILSKIFVQSVEQASQIENEPNKIFIAAGVIGLFGAITTALSLKKDVPIVRELNKLEYRDAHRETLDSIEKYYNSLANLPEERAEEIRRIRANGEDPFGADRIDSFTTSEMESIVNCVEAEKNLGFTYQKK